MGKIIRKSADIIRRIHPGEIVVSTGFLVFVNLAYFPEDPLFLQSTFNPYYFLIIFFSSFYGKIPGFTALILSLTSILLAPSISGNARDLSGYFDHAFALLSGDTYLSNFIGFMFISVISSFILGEIRDNLGMVIAKLKEHKNTLLNMTEKLRYEIRALSLVNEEYQDRILGQQNSLISLYSTMVALNSLNLDTIYPNILDAVAKFIGAVKCSLWKYNRDENELELMSSHGWVEETMEQRVRKPDTEDLIGWVARNNVMFSVKMLQKFKNLQQLDTKRNILTVPINIDKKVWGVINIEEMPFIKYNLYSEQLLMMISDLASPSIANALRFIEITKKGERNPITGFNSLDELFSIMKEEFDRAKAGKLNLSFVILELTNFIQLQEIYQHDDILRLLKEVSKLAVSISKGNAMIFQYKEGNQFSIMLPNMDHDGAAMFCLNLIEQSSKQKYIIGNDSVFPEILVGYSTLRPNHKTEEDIFLLAENLLLMQKI